ncbi:Rab1a [Hexamita inflata]|uniref:Rab1a n=1 Tax=Hexamita inflata TaxID=28002 RepID=A0AA86TDI8_9EUKA|nr:Rab1a [Hexamita inflata]
MNKVFKVVALGATAVGKSSILLRAARNQYTDGHQPTIGAVYYRKTVQLPKTEEVIKLELWDTAGQERYNSVTQLYYRNACVILIVFSMDDADSLQKAIDWNNVLVDQNSDATRCLVGNKSDICKKCPRAEQYAQDNNLKYFVVSAKMGNGVEELFQHIAQSCNKLKQHTQSAKVLIVEPKEYIKDKKFCC